MEKRLIKTKEDLKAAIDFFGKDNSVEIKRAVKSYPCILIGNYSEDIDFGDGYDFCAVSKEDFENQQR